MGKDSRPGARQCGPVVERHDYRCVLAVERYDHQKKRGRTKRLRFKASQRDHSYSNKIRRGQNHNLASAHPYPLRSARWPEACASV